MFEKQSWELFQGDAGAVLRNFPDESVHCIVTSPPYWMLRDYGVDGQIGLEEDPHEYIDKLVAVFHEAFRVLRSDGTLWINIGDTFSAGGKSGGGSFMEKRKNKGWQSASSINGFRMPPQGMRRKELVGIPWMLAFALRADGWILRAENIWSKKNPQPEAVNDRPARSHEQVFLLTKLEKYYYDHEAVKEPVTGTAHARGAAGVNPKARRADNMGVGWGYISGPKWNKKPRTKQNPSFSAAVHGLVDTRRMRTVWTMATQSYKDDHYAAFPEKLPLRCILAGCPKGGIVLDPFVGRGTTGVVAVQRGRRFIGIDLNQDYIELARKNIEEAARQLFLKGIVDE